MQKNKDVIARNINGQIVLVPIHFSSDGLYAYHLNELGSFLWEKLDQEINPKNLAILVSEEFSIDEETAVNDVNEFLEDLKSKEILR
jgi:hypothetical protein